MKSCVIYHNPKCGSSRRTLELIRSHGIEPEIIEYLRFPPGPESIEMILQKLAMRPRDLIRKKEKIYSELKLDRVSLTDDELITAMAEHPSLIERPIVVFGNKAALGRPPENVLQIL